MKSSKLFLIIFSALLIFLQNLPYAYLSINSPKDTVYLGAQRYYPDYYGTYLSRINEGTKGRLKSPFLFTNEINNRTIIHWEYNVLGKIGSIFNLPPHLIFIFSRSILLLAFIIISYWFIGLFFKNSFHRNLILILSFFYNGFSFLNLNNFYQPPSFINYITSEPHHLIGFILTILTLYSISKNRLLASAALSFFIGFVHGTSTLSLIAALILFGFLQLIYSKKNLARFTKDNLVILLSLLLLPISLIFWKIIFNKNPQLHYILIEWEKFYFQTDMEAPFLPIILAYFAIMGLLILLSALGLKKFLEENKKLGLLIFSFLASNLILILFGYIPLSTSKIRFYQTPYLLLFSIMAYYGLLFLAKKTRIKNGFFLFISTTLIIILGIPNIISGINKFIEPYKNSADLSVYLPTKWYQAILWLENTPEDSVILSCLKAGEIIGAVPGRRVVIGVFEGSYDFGKVYLAEQFFKGQMTPTEAKNYLQKKRVNYVFYGLEEKNYGNLNQYSLLLQKVFENEDASIYKVTF